MTLFDRVMLFLFKSPFLLTLAVTVPLSLSPSDAATLYGVSGVESSSELSSYVVSNGGLSEDSLILLGNATEGLSESFATSDPEGALSWLKNLPNDERNNVIFVGLISVSLGSSETISEGRDSALRLAMERWLTNSESGDPDREITPRDRYTERDRDRSISRTDPEIALNWLNSSGYYAVGNYSEGTSGIDFIYLPVIPEPSTMLMGALAGLGLLRRRR